jgi:3-oxoacyl-[acyl-carrier protein] reductase
VIVNGRTSERVNAAMEQIRSRHAETKLEALPVDLSNAGGAKEALQRFPDVDVLVNNLGIFEPSRSRRFPMRNGSGSSR